MTRRLEIDRDACVGAGMCVVSAPLVFDQDEVDGRVVLILQDHDETLMPTIEEAVSLCPSGALSLSGNGSG